MNFCSTPATCRKSGLPDSRGVFLLSHGHALLQRATSDLEKVFCFGVHPTPLPDPDASHQLWVHLAVDSGCKTTRNGLYKIHQVRTTFGSCDVEKVHAVVARSTFPSQNVKNTRVRTTFGHQIFRFTKMILRDRCSTLYDLASLFVADAVL